MLGNAVLDYFRQNLGFHDSSDGTLPVPGLSRAVVQEVHGQHIVVGVSAKEDHVIVHIGLSMAEGDHQYFDTIRFHSTAAGYLFKKIPLEIHMEETKNTDMAQILAPLQPALEEARAIINGKTGAYWMGGEFPITSAEEIKKRNGLVRRTGIIGRNVLMVPVIAALIGAALGPEEFEKILQYIPDELLLPFVSMARDDWHRMLQDSSSFISSGGYEARRLSGFIAFVQSLPYAMVLAPIVTVIAEYRRKASRVLKYIDDL